MISRGLNMTAHLHLMSKLSMSGDRPSLTSVHIDDCTLRYLLHCLIHQKCDFMLRGVEPKALENQRSQYQILDTSAVQQCYQLLSVFTCDPKTNCIPFSIPFSINHTLLIREG
jgi:hypothetical protein